jgi:hypothetical protein
MNGKGMTVSVAALCHSTFVETLLKITESPNQIRERTHSLSIIVTSTVRESISPLLTKLTPVLHRDSLHISLLLFLILQLLLRNKVGL